MRRPSVQSYGTRGSRLWWLRAWRKTRPRCEPNSKPNSWRAAKTVEEAFPKPVTQSTTGPAAVADYQSSRATLRWYRRWLLLYKPARPRAWVPRVFFYLMAVELIALPFILFDPEERDDWIYGVIGVLALTLLFRGLSG